MIILIVFKIDYHRYKTGASFITFLIGPATVSLAVPLYQNLELLKKNWKIVLLTIFSGVIVHALVIGVLAVILRLSDAMVATVVPKSVTTAIALDISKGLSGIENLTVAIVIITGILGAVVSPFIFKVFKINSPIAQGLSLGSAAHAVGTSRAAELGEVHASMATLSLIITGITTVIISPLVYNIIVSLF
ncbi:Inner membrane protein yohK [Haploplasma axanthum]|uniref:Inner membrane protein yohK n=2 Tax=Haploplasma axanthum TaxID=29552 RepID=A0A449BEH6_HAPAX|nr:Inner membrane protein yohK [Haploplasma axanthum]